jgi:flagellar biosynthetic protein FliR
MTVRIDIAWLLGTLLLSARVAAATMLTPIFGPTQIPVPVRVLIAVALAAFLVLAVPVALPPIDTATDLAIATLGEILLGMSLAFGFLVAYAATQIAGRVLDIQLGYGAASVLNPTTQTPAPLIGTVLGMAAVAVFLAMDGHHVLLRALALSVETYPPGKFASDLDLSEHLKFSSVMFTFGLALAAPVMFSLLLADIALAVMARSMPQLNVFVLSFSVKIVLGLIGLAMSVKFSGATLTALFESTYRVWDGVAVGPR